MIGPNEGQKCQNQKPETEGIVLVHIKHYKKQENINYFAYCAGKTALTTSEKQRAEAMRRPVSLIYGIQTRA